MFWRIADGLVRRFGYRLVGITDGPPKYPPDFGQREIEIIETVRSETLTSVERIVALVRAARYVSASGIPGAFVECGVWRGGSSMAALLAFLDAGDRVRPAVLFDTFAGMTPPTDIDVDYTGQPAAIRMHAEPNLRAEASLNVVRGNIERTGYPAALVRFVVGRVEDTIPQEAPDRIALLRLDTDWYESTRHELEHLFPRLSIGGVLIIDDYGYWQGSRRAVDEYLANHDTSLFLARIDKDAVMAVRWR